ncbi:MAG TPA: hypothetical protein VHX99_02930 [Rhizomicrobium sp.]|jgi:hypothetical protein|nr:hypothetical protein [Rhizomicrobium sp.]
MPDIKNVISRRSLLKGAPEKRWTSRPQQSDFVIVLPRPLSAPSKAVIQYWKKEKTDPVLPKASPGRPIPISPDRSGPLLPMMVKKRQP